MTTNTIFRLTLITFVLLFSGAAAKTLAAPATMLLDYYHTGNATQELLSMDRAKSFRNLLP
jgi:hypothetical protein